MNATHAGGFGAGAQMGNMNATRRVGLAPVTGHHMKNDQ
jgi:hypothetical protein